MKVACIFPGQGSQTVGMGLQIYSEFAASRQIFDQADEILKFKLSTLCFEGPQEILNLTANTQPALLTVSAAIAEVFRQAVSIPVAFTAGHSLGEYTAHWFSGSLSFESAVQLVRIRGEAMQTATPPGVGAMAAILGISESDLQEVISVSAENQVLQAANFNGPGQIVISGHKEAVERAMAAAKTRGAKKCVSLPVSAPFHCALMEPAASTMRENLTRHPISPLKIPLVCNADALFLPDIPDAIVDSLVRQVTAPVRWEQSIKLLHEQGVTVFVELGAGRVLTNLVKRIQPEAECLAVNDTATLNAAIERLQKS